MVVKRRSWRSNGVETGSSGGQKEVRETRPEALCKRDRARPGHRDRARPGQRRSASAIDGPLPSFNRPRGPATASKP